MNPPAKSHWSYKRYIEDEVAGRAAFKINPIDVKENLPASYLARLEALPERMRQRFLHGEFTSDIEGALWSWELVQGSRAEQDGEDGKIVVAIDPAVTSNENSDETGIVVACLKGNGAKVLADYSCKETPDGWAKKAIWAYRQHGASGIVIEVNHGRDLLKTVIQHHDDTIPIIEVNASKGKHTRAEPVVMLYEQGLVEHEEGLSELEDQMMSWVPHVSSSPDRVDALVWALTHLMLDTKDELSIGWV